MKQIPIKDTIEELRRAYVQKDDLLFENALEQIIKGLPHMATTTQAKARAMREYAKQEIKELSAQEAQEAYDSAIPVPMSDERIQEIVDFATGADHMEKVQRLRKINAELLAACESALHAMKHARDIAINTGGVVYFEEVEFYNAHIKRANTAIENAKEHP